MEQIVLDMNLGYVLATLDMAQRGEILTALFEGEYHGDDEAVKNIFCYFSLVCEKKEAKRRKMHELSLRGVAARKKKREEDFSLFKTFAYQTDEASPDRTVNQTVDRTLNRPVDRRLFERKEAKESINNKNNIFYQQKLLLGKDGKKVFSPPDVAEVRAYVEKCGYQVNAETFVDFYDSRGWRVGTTPILNWQATVRLWHRRATSLENSLCGKKDDETYWHELMTKRELCAEKEIITTTRASGVSSQNVAENEKPVVIDLKQKPFERFMNRVEKYDILGDEK